MKTIRSRILLLSFLFAIPGAGSLWAQTDLPAHASAPAEQRVFVCAHSFMIFTARLLPPMAQAAGIHYLPAGQQMLGGSRVIQHWNLPDDKNRAKEALRAGNVDVLTLSPHFLLPDEGIDNFTKLGLEANPRLRVLVQASWPANDGILTRPFHNEERNSATMGSLQEMQKMHHSLWFDSLEKQVRALNAAVGHDAVYIIPVADAVTALRERIAEGKAPGLSKQTDLFNDDLGHPKAPLAELVTYCHFATIYGRSPEGLPVPADLKNIPQGEELNRLMQRIAWETVSGYPMSGVK
jgi:hypothetical protein